MMICPHCQSENREGAKFCNECGSPLLSCADKTQVIDAVAFGGTATYLSERLARGSTVAVSGRLHWSQWEAKDGSGKRSKVEIFVDDVELMSQAKEAQAPVDAVYEDDPLPF